MEAISTAIVSNINQRCQCGLSDESLTDGVLRCFPSSPQAVTFRAILHGTATASSSEIVSHIKQWITNGVTIPVQSVLINVDSSCTVNISSFDDRECQLMSFSTQPRNDNTSAIIGGIASALLLVLISAGGAVIILLWFRKRRQRSSRYGDKLLSGDINIHDNY